MFKFITDTSSYNLKKKLTLIYILNALDIVFTFTLLKTGLFFEANKLMVNVVTNPYLSILVKLVIPGILIIYLLFKIDELPCSQLKLCTICVNLVAFIYLCINLLHLGYALIYVAEKFL